jgi:hypothetical protein
VEMNREPGGRLREDPNEAILAMTIPLVSEADLMGFEEELSRSIVSVPERFLFAIDDPVYGPAFRRYLLLSHGLSWLASKVPDLDVRSVFYSRYYWFLMLIRLYQSRTGDDAGMEQQAFQMLEAAEIEINWSIIEAIEAQIQKEIGKSNS